MVNTFRLAKRDNSHTTCARLASHVEGGNFGVQACSKMECRVSGAKLIKRTVFLVRRELSHIISSCAMSNWPSAKTCVVA